MELHKIEEILERYLEGETSLKEEQTLRNFFTEEEVPAHLSAYKALFGFYKNESEKVYEQPIQMPKKKNNFYKWTGLAASIVAIVVLSVVFNQPTRTTTINPINHSANFSLALENTQDLLYMMTGAIEDGQQQLGYLNELSKTQKQLIK